MSKSIQADKAISIYALEIDEVGKAKSTVLLAKSVTSLTESVPNLNHGKLLPQNFFAYKNEIVTKLKLTTSIQ